MYTYVGRLNKFLPMGSRAKGTLSYFLVTRFTCRSLSAYHRLRRNQKGVHDDLNNSSATSWE